LVVTSTTVVTNLNADLWDGYQFSDYLNQAVRTSDSPTFSKIRLTAAGNSSGGNILMGPVGEGTNKFSTLTGTHYNATSQAQGITIIGAYATAAVNQIYIGGNIYEANPATQIDFYTHNAITHATGGTNRMSINSSGNVTANVDFRAPIFYDSDNTAFFINGAGNSNLNTLQTYSYQGNSNVAGTGNASFHPSGIYSTGTNWLYGTMYLNGNSINDVSYIGMIGTNTTPINITGASHKYLTINPGNGYEAMVRYIGGTGSSWYVGKRTASQLVGPESFHFYSEAAGQTVSGIDTSGNLFSIGSMRSPIFYDQDNTAFFLNPNTTATSLRIAGGIKQDNLVGRPYAVWGATGATGAVVIKFPGNTSNYGMIHAEIDIYEYSGNAACTVIVGGHNWNGAWYNINAEVVGQTDKPVRVGVKDGRYCIVIGNGSSSWSYGQVVLRKIQNGSYYSGIMDVAEGYSVAIESDSYSNISGDLRNLRTPLSFTAGVNVTAGNAMYSPIYYDSNNTGYYVDPNGNSILTTALFNLNASSTLTLTPAGTNASMIKAGAGDELYIGGNDTWQMRFNGGNVLMDNGGYLQNNQSIRTPIYYDYNNTAYYGDFASTNNFNQTEQNGRLWYSNYLVSRNNGGLMGDYNTNGTASKVIWTIGESWPIGNMYGLGYEYGSGYDHHLALRNNGTTYSRFGFAGGMVITGTGTATSDWRAPVFYDSADTTFRLDLNSSSRLRNLYVGDGGSDWGDPGGWGTQLHVSNAPHSIIRVYARSEGIETGIFSHVGGLSVAGSWTNHDFRIARNFAYRMIFYSGYTYSEGYLQAADSLRAPIFYDSNDTTYYVDPASGTNTYGRFQQSGAHGNSQIGVRLLAGNNGAGTGEANLRMWVSEPGVTWTDAGFGYNVTNDGGSPAGFGRINGSHGQAYMRFSTAGDLYFYNTNTSGTRVTNMELYPNNTVYFNNYATGGNSLRAPIFYDSNDTSYYVDANGTARLRYVVANNGIRVDGNEHIYLDYNYGQTIFGVYTSVRYQGVWAMGTSYRLPVDGTSSGNLYGLAWSHPNTGGQASYLNTHGLLVMENGTTNAAIASVIWARADMRSPIFYDHDTGWYLDANGTSNLNRFTNRTHAAMNRGHHWITPRFDYTGDSNYWTGTFGWGTSAGNWDNAWRAGFAGWDIWGGGTGHPQGGGYIHAQGIVSGLHYATSDGGSAYGWMMVGAGDATANRYWARGKWGGGVSGWKEFAMYGGGGSGDLRANVFYDSDDTGYYADFNSTSNSCIRQRGGTLHGPNPTWGAYLYVGSNGRPDGTASVVATNGNLHLDCQNGYETYINHYSGNRTYLYEIRTNFIYDRDNTGYYLDINGGNRLNEIYIDQGYNYGWWRNYGCTGLYNQSYGRGIWAAECGGNPYGNYTTYDGGRNGWQGWGIGSRYTFMSTMGDNVGVHDSARGWVWLMSGAILYLYYAGSDRMSMQPYGVYVYNDIRSPIFYDHDTGYYGDFNSTSRFNYIINNNIYCYDWIFAQGNIIAYYSDERLKTKIGNIQNPLEKISKLNGFYYVNNELAHSVGYTDTKVQLGLSAQEVQSILPEIVHLAPFDTDIDSETKEIKGSKSGENYLTIDYDKLVPLLVEAIKEQQTIIDKQNNEISEIKEMLKTLFNDR
jgi:hypothetical protein